MLPPKALKYLIASTLVFVIFPGLLKDINPLAKSLF